MAPDTASPKPETQGGGIGGERLFWSRRVSLTTRILAVNIIALALLAGSLFYLDSYRKQLLEERFKLARTEVELSADALERTSNEERRAFLAESGTKQVLRLRLFDRKGRLSIDSFAEAPPPFALIDPEGEPWYQNAARLLDRGVDYLVGAPPVPAYVEPDDTSIEAWPEAKAALAVRRSVVFLRYAPDRTPIITAAMPVGRRGEALLSLRNAIDITQSVRDARQTLVIVIALTLLISIQLSLFLARTIVQPLRALVRAAVRVRLGRDRKVVVPRLPERGDEIGLLARAISDMTAALRQRIDGVESFAADVAHEIKNPLASLRSALESLEKVEDPALRRQLTNIAAHDVQRIDRLITEIADASRIDAELSRATFESVDLNRLLKELIAGREQRGANRGITLKLARRGTGSTAVMGVATRLERVFENLLDNAASFSPTGGQVEVVISRGEGVVIVTVTDEGPGIPAEEREKVFERFHSLRPEEEAFGDHSGLGLAIARTIVEAHDGTLTAEDRAEGRQGAALVVTLPEAAGR